MNQLLRIKGIIAKGQSGKFRYKADTQNGFGAWHLSVAGIFAKNGLSLQLIKTTFHSVGSRLSLITCCMVCGIPRDGQSFLASNLHPGTECKVPTNSSVAMKRM